MTAWLSTGLSELLSTELAVGGQLVVIPGETISRLSGDLGTQDPASFDLERIRNVGRSLGADYLVICSYRQEGPPAGRSLHLISKLVETRQGETLISSERTAPEDELFELVTAAGNELRQELGVGRISFSETASVRATLPSSPEAFRHYLEGLQRLRSFDALAARETLRQAIRIDPSYALAHAALSRAWSALGYDLQAEDSARRAYELAEGLPRKDYLSIEGRYHEEVGSWQSAIDSYRELRRVYPDSVDYGLRLAQAQITAGRSQEAMATLRGLAAPEREDPRIELMLANAAFSVADHEAQLAAASRAEGQARALGSLELQADALRHKGEALYRLLRTDEAEVAFQKAEKLFSRIGDQSKTARTLSSIADVLLHKLDYQGAERLYEQALSIHRRIGHRAEVARMQNNLAFLLYNRGELAAARNKLEEAAAVGRELGDRYQEATYLDTLVEVLLRQGDLTVARELAQEELSLYQQIGNRRWSGFSYFNLGRVALASGDARRALEFQETALVIGDEIGDPYLTGFVLNGLARGLLAAGRVSEASRISDDALSLRAELQGTATLNESQVTAAVILLERGRADEAAELAAQAVSGYREQARSDDEAAAAAVYASARLAQGRPGEARAALDLVQEKADASQNPTVRLQVAIAAARWKAAIGRHGEALRDLESTVHEARKLGLASLELEARLAWREAELAATGGATVASSSTKARLEALAEDAVKAGFELIAEKAAAAGTRAGIPIVLPSAVRDQIDA